MNRRAIELQFHWIFILIAGAVILAFFFSVVEKQRSLSEEKLSITLASQMDAIFTGAIESKGTVQALATPLPGIAFGCSNVCECTYRIGTKSTEFRDKLLFAPALIKEQDAQAWAVEWKLPFRIANFLLLTNPRIKYYLVYDAGNQLSSQLYARMSKVLPREISMEVLSSGPGVLAGLYPRGAAHTRFVFLGSGPVSPDTLGLPRNEWKEQDVSGVWLNPDDSAHVVFFEKREPDELGFDSRKSLLAGDATTYAAMFAAGHQMYDCMMRRAFREMGITAEIASRRAHALQNAMDASVPPRIECAYKPAWEQLDDVAQKAGLLGAKFPDAEEARGNVVSAQPELQRQNDNLIRQSCPELY